MYKKIEQIGRSWPYKGDRGSLGVIKKFYLCTNPMSKTRIKLLKIEFGVYMLDQATTSAPVKCSWVQNNILIFLALRRKYSIKYTSHLTRFMTSLKVVQGKRINNLVEIAYLKIITITGNDIISIKIIVIKSVDIFFLQTHYL